MGVDREERVPYRDAGAAMRHVIAAALAQEHPLHEGELRTLLVVLALTGTYSRVEDRVTVEAIAGAAGRSERQTARNLHSLAARNIGVTYEPGKFKGHPARIAIESATRRMSALPDAKDDTQNDTLWQEEPDTAHDALLSPKPDTGRPQSPTSRASVSTEKTEKEKAGPPCPECGEPLRDQRAAKAAGRTSPRAPDWTCSDRSCRGAVWRAEDLVDDEDTNPLADDLLAALVAADGPRSLDELAAELSVSTDEVRDAICDVDEHRQLGEPGIGPYVLAKHREWRARVVEQLQGEGRRRAWPAFFLTNQSWPAGEREWEAAITRAGIDVLEAALEILDREPAIGHREAN